MFPRKYFFQEQCIFIHRSKTSAFSSTVRNTSQSVTFFERPVIAILSNNPSDGFTRDNRHRLTLDSLLYSGTPDRVRQSCFEV